MGRVAEESLRRAAAQWLEGSGVLVPKQVFRVVLIAHVPPIVLAFCILFPVPPCFHRSGLALSADPSSLSATRAHTAAVRGHGESFHAWLTGAYVRALLKPGYIT